MLAPLIVRAADTPEPNDVVAGWTGFTVFVLLILAVAFLGWSLTRQLRKVDQAEDQGLYGRDDAPAGDEPADGADAEKRD